MNLLNKMLGDILDVPAARIDDDLHMGDVEKWNSLTHIELIVALEDAYKIQLTQDDVIEMVSVRAIKTVLKKHGVSPE